LNDIANQSIGLRDVLLYLISGGAGTVAYFLMEKVKELREIERPDYKRCFAYGLTGAIAIAAWMALIVLEYTAMPGSLKGWAEQGFAVLFVALTTNQGLHTALKLRPRPAG